MTGGFLLRYRNRKGENLYKITTVYGDEFIIESKQTAEEITDFLNTAGVGYIEFVAFKNTERKNIILKLSEISRVEEL